MSNNWSNDIEVILERIRENSVILSEHHKSNYHRLKDKLRYFRIPIIILSALNSVFAVGLQPYVPQQTISALVSVISLACGIVTSIELYLAIQSSMENELMASKSYYVLGIDIYKVLSLYPEHRTIDGRTYLEEKYNQYVKLLEASHLLNDHIEDKLTPIIEKYNPNKITETQINNELKDLSPLQLPESLIKNDEIKIPYLSLQDKDLEKNEDSEEFEKKEDDNKIMKASENVSLQNIFPSKDTQYFFY